MNQDYYHEFGNAEEDPARYIGVVKSHLYSTEKKESPKRKINYKKVTKAVVPKGYLQHQPRKSRSPKRKQIVPHISTTSSLHIGKGQIGQGQSAVR